MLSNFEDPESNKSIGPMIEFLQALKIKSLNVSIDMFETLKERMDSYIQAFDEPKLLLLLRETFQMIAVRELKSIPISILKRLKVIPPQYLDLLAKRNQLSVIGHREFIRYVCYSTTLCGRNFR